MPREVGGLQAEKNAKADLVILDYSPPTPMTSENLIGHILFGIADAPVDTTIVAGRVLMKKGKIQDVDEEEIHARARETAQKVWERFRDL